MDSRLSALFDRIRESAPYEDVFFDDINAVNNTGGDNALRWAVHFNDLDAPRLLIDAGIDVNQRGDLGRTPLHEACAAGHGDMALLLVEHGGDLYAQTEGDVPFTLARLNLHPVGAAHGTGPREGRAGLAARTDRAPRA
jgi:ankyrin repeat protein